MKLNMLDTRGGFYERGESVLLTNSHRKGKKRKKEKISQISMDHFLKKDGSMQWTHKTNQLGWGGGEREGGGRGI
jgi:hypothetical protein